MPDADSVTRVGQFLPLPRVALLRDRNRQKVAVCTLCYEDTVYRHERRVPSPQDSMAILPCGHIYCLGCITDTLSSGCEAECPTCHISLRHSDCGHYVRPRLLYEETLLTLPKVVKSAAELPKLCRPCTKAKEVKHAMYLHIIFSIETRRLTELYERNQDEGTFQRLVEADRLSHEIVMNSFTAQVDW
ncbi:hypothetical protein RB601_006182 [Gaeumannomyces tritici]